MLITTSDYGCIDTMEQVVIVLPEVIIYAPNTFTPDGDEHNQAWGIYIEGVDIFDFQLLIYNRWGELIWENNDPFVKWDGTYNGSIVPQGTYTWKASARDFMTDNKYEFKGHINLLR
jgi:gliding motility-associated-like protein